MRARTATDLQAAQESSAPPPSPITGEPVGQTLPQASDVRPDTQTHGTALVSVGQMLPGFTFLSHDERTTGRKSQNLVLVGEGQSPRCPQSPWHCPTRGRPQVWRGLWREGSSCFGALEWVSACVGVGALIGFGLLKVPICPVGARAPTPTQDSLLAWGDQSLIL